ncbi:MAG: DUF5706 domain-containing protein [Phycisphaerales bacterium]
MVLSQVADHKANMLTTVSALAATLLFSLVNGESSLRVPATMMIVTCVTTCCFAVLASMPSLRRPKRIAKERGALFNPLFFGDFVGMTWEAYLEEMERIMADPSATYEAQVREIYAMGQYLAHRKFLYLRRAYLALFTGILASAVVWLFLQLQSTGVLDTAG